MTATAGPRRDPADPEVQAALRRLSAGVIRSLQCIEESRRSRAAAEAPPGEPPPKEVAAGTPPPAACHLPSTTTTTTQRCSLEGGHVG